MRKIFSAKFIVLAIVITLFSACSNNATSDYNVKNYGAKGVKTQLATQQIQTAIDKCNAAGGGRVYFPPGEYVAGTIVMKDNVTLYLESGATLYASNDTNDYKTDFKVFKKDDSGKKDPSGATPVFIYAKDVKNIGIMGKGTIHGQARRTYEPLQEVDGFIRKITENAEKSGVELKMYYKVEPFVCMVFLENSSHITIRDISLIESCDWTLHFKWCNKIFIDNIYLESSLEAGVNADGIDIDGCKDVVITNSIITTGDDAIVLKSTITHPDFRDCENVTVLNCVLYSTSTALKLGTESYGDFRNITFTNCVIRNANRGLSIVVRDGALVENVIFSNITIETNRKHFNWWGNGDPIWLVVLKRRDNSKVGMIKNVIFDNIIAYGQGTSKIEGFEGTPLENIELNNVRFVMYPEQYPDKRATHAFEAHTIKGLSLTDVKVEWNTDSIIEPMWANGFNFSDIDGLRLDKLSGRQAQQGKGAMISLNNVQNAIVERCLPTPNTNIFLNISGANTKNIILNDNYTYNALKNIVVEPSAKAGEVKQK